MIRNSLFVTDGSQVMKKNVQAMTIKLGKVTSAITLWVCRSAVSIACEGLYYQLGVSKKMKKVQ